MHGSDKPQAPVSLKVTQANQGGGRYEITLVATPTDDVKSAQLSLVLPEGVTSVEENKPVAFGASVKGRSLTLTRHVQLSVPGADLIADVRVDNGVSQRNRPQIIRVGAAKPAEAAKPTTRVTLPNGDVVEEVRQ